MKVSNIKSTWGSVIEFDDPMEFFNYDKDYWKQLMYEKKLLIFKRMKFTLLDYAKFGYYFGMPWKKDDYVYSRERTESVFDNDQELIVSKFSNLIHGQHIIANTEMPWHADIPNKSVNPFPHRALWIVKNPNPEVSGKTRWLNIDHGISYLRQDLKDLIPRITIKQQSWYQMGTDEKIYPFIKHHPVTGQESLRLNFYVGCLPNGRSNNAWIKTVYIDGVAQPDCSLIQDYIDDLLQHDELTHCHQWDDFDIAIYDNYPFIHGRTELKLGVDQSNNERMFYRMNIDHENG